MKALYFTIAGLCILYLIYDSGKNPMHVDVSVDAIECETIKWVQFGRVNTVYLCQDRASRTVHYHSLQAISDDDFSEHVKPVLDSLMIDLFMQ